MYRILLFIVSAVLTFLLTILLAKAAGDTGLIVSALSIINATIITCASLIVWPPKK